MNRFATLTLWLLASSAMAGRHDDTVINSGSELYDWCKDESAATLMGRGLKPFNWTASYWDKADTLMVKGMWRTSSTTNVLVECSVARGTRASLASLSIQDSQ